MIKLFIFLLFIISVNSQQKENALKIYVFNCGQADCQLIVFPSGYSILYDLGEDLVMGYRRNANYVAERVIEILGKKEIDVLVISHYHHDHTGHPGTYDDPERTGILYFIEDLGFTFKKYIDRDCGVYKGDSFDDCRWGNIEWHTVDEESASHTRFVCYGASLKDKTKLSAIREVAKLCSTDQIAPPDEGAKVEILMRDAYGIKNKDGKNLWDNRIGENKDGVRTISENDYSISLKITFGEFSYSLCGDLSGKLYDDPNGYTYHDIESYVAPMMGEVDVYHSNHHGLHTSTNELWVNTLKPSVTVISGRTGEADVEALKRLVAVGCITYATNDCLNYWKSDPHPDESRIFNDDIVITVPVGSDVFYVSKKDGSNMESYMIKKNKKPGKCQILV